MLLHHLKFSKGISKDLKGEEGEQRNQGLPNIVEQIESFPKDPESKENRKNILNGMIIDKNKHMQEKEIENKKLEHSHFGDFKDSFSACHFRQLQLFNFSVHSNNSITFKGKKESKLNTS